MSGMEIAEAGRVYGELGGGEGDMPYGGGQEGALAAEIRGFVAASERGWYRPRFYRAGAPSRDATRMRTPSRRIPFSPSPLIGRRRRRTCGAPCEVVLCARGIQRHPAKSFANQRFWISEIERKTIMLVSIKPPGGGGNNASRAKKGGARRLAWPILDGPSVGDLAAAARDAQKRPANPPPLFPLTRNARLEGAAAPAATCPHHIAKTTSETGIVTLVLLFLLDYLHLDRAHPEHARYVPYLLYSLEHKFLTLPQASISVDASKKGSRTCARNYRSPSSSSCGTGSCLTPPCGGHGT